MPPLPTSRRNLPGKHFLPLEVLHTARRESPTLRVGSSSTSSKLWTLSSDTRDSQFGLTRAHASMQGAEAEGNWPAMINERPDRPIVTSCAALFLPTKRCTLHLRYTESRSGSRHLVIYYSRGCSEFLVPADRDDRSRCFTFVNLCIPILVQTKVRIISFCDIY